MDDGQDEYSPGGTWLRTVFHCHRCHVPLFSIAEDEEENQVFMPYSKYRNTKTGFMEYHCIPCGSSL